MRLAVLLAATVWTARRTLFVVRIDGASMEPTFRSGDAVLAVQTSVDPRIRHGDVVVCRLPGQLQGPTGLLVKRVTGLAGDEVEGVGVLAPGQVFVCGDGSLSFDSRSFGPLPVSAVRGRVVAQLSLTPRRHLSIGG